MVKRQNMEKHHVKRLKEALVGRSVGYNMCFCYLNHHFVTAIDRFLVLDWLILEIF